MNREIVDPQGPWMLDATLMFFFFSLKWVDVCLLVFISPVTAPPTKASGGDDFMSRKGQKVL